MRDGVEEEATVRVELFASDAVVAADGRAVERHGAEERVRRRVLRVQADAPEGGAEADRCQVRDCNNSAPPPAGYWKSCRPRAKYYVPRGQQFAARG